MSRPQRARKPVCYTEAAVDNDEVDQSSSDDEASSRAQKRAKPVKAVVAAAYRSLTPPSDGSVLVGRTVTKSFPPDGTFEGTIKSFDEAESLWKVLYEDGDEEEIKFDELVVILNEPYTEAATVAAEKGSEDGVASTKDTDIAEEASVEAPVVIEGDTPFHDGLV